MKLRSTKTLKGELDTVFSLYIRRRDSFQQNGERFFKCISCNRYKKYNQMHCGHYYVRKIMSTRYDEKNCNGQCVNCNSFTEGNRQGYAVGLIQKYGKDILDLLLIKSHTLNKMANFEYEALITYYKTEINKLK